MSMTKSAVLAATTSSITLIAGAYLGHILTKQRVIDSYEIIVEEQVRQAKAFYSQRNKTGDYSDPVALAEKLVRDDEQDDDEINVVDQTGIEPADPEDILSKVDPADRVNYNKYSQDYKGPAVERETYTRSSIQPGPNETMEEFEERVAREAQARVAAVIDRSGETDLLKEVSEEVVDTPKTGVRNIFDTNGVERIEDEMKRTRDEAHPFIVTQEEFYDNEPQHNQVTVMYYQKDNTLADDKDQPVDNLEGVIGSQNLKFGYGSSDPNIVYVRNNEMDLDFEVCLDPGSFAEEVLGAPPARPNRMP